MAAFALAPPAQAEEVQAQICPTLAQLESTMLLAEEARARTLAAMPEAENPAAAARLLEAQEAQLSELAALRDEVERVRAALEIACD